MSNGDQSTPKSERKPTLRRNRLMDVGGLAELKIESVWMNVYHGGTRPAARDLSIFIDNVVVARKYIGPVGPAH